MFLCILQPPPGFDPQIPPPQIAVPSIPPPQQFEYGHGYGGDYLIKFVCVCVKSLKTSSCYYYCLPYSESVTISIIKDQKNSINCVYILD